MLGTAIILLFTLTFVVLKIYVTVKTKKCTNKVSLVGKTVIVTGANQGIGYETAVEFAKRGGRVILACRNKDRANEAKTKIIMETKNNNIEIAIVDMGSLKSVREFAKTILETESRLDILVNNAGLGSAKNLLTEDGYRNLLQTNYLAPFLLTMLLIDLLKKSAPSRIINLSSIMGKYGKVDPYNMNTFPGHGQDYNRSKLLNILFTIRLAELLKSSNISVFSVHPGAVKTDIFRAIKGWKKSILNFVMNIFFKTAEEGAQTTIYTATEPGIEYLTGEHFEECAPIQRYPSAQDPNLVRNVFDQTLELLKCKDQFKDILNY